MDENAVLRELPCLECQELRAMRVRARLGGVVLAIKDNGQGFEIKPRQAGPHGFGVPTMFERANRLGARMQINTGKGIGTEVRMSVPLSGNTSKERNNQ